DAEEHPGVLGRWSERLELVLLVRGQLVHRMDRTLTELDRLLLVGQDVDNFGRLRRRLARRLDLDVLALFAVAVLDDDADLRPARDAVDAFVGVGQIGAHDRLIAGAPARPRRRSTWLLALAFFLANF